MKTLFWLALVTAGFVFSACNDDVAVNAVSDTDRSFVAMAAEVNQSQVEIGQLAFSKSASAEVKAYAERISTTHQTMLNELMPLAASGGIQIPVKLNPFHGELLKRLRTLEGYEFDTAFINNQVKDHQLTLGFYQHEIDNGDDPAVRDYAIKYLPAIQSNKEESDGLVNDL